MKCHWCQKELKQIESYESPNTGFGTVQWECPDVHAMVSIDPKTNQITHYTFFADVNGKRYKVHGNRERKQTTLLVKAGRTRYDNALTIQRYLNYAPNKEGLLEGQAIFKKLKTLLVFS